MDGALYFVHLYLGPTLSFGFELQSLFFSLNIFGAC